jgi:hypothetical protein
MALIAAALPPIIKYLIAISFLKSYQVASSFHPEMVLLPNICVKLRSCLCDVLQYVSAQALVFLNLEQKSSFPIWKLRCAHPAFPDGHHLVQTTLNY